MSLHTPGSMSAPRRAREREEREKERLKQREEKDRGRTGGLVTVGHGWGTGKTTDWLVIEIFFPNIQQCNWWILGGFF